MVLVSSYNVQTCIYDAGKVWCVYLTSFYCRDLSYNSLSGSLPSGIGRLTTLQIL